MSTTPDQEATPRLAVAELAALIARLEPRVRSQALTHSSWTERRLGAWERLAFLGDSVLGLAVAEHLYSTFPRSDIGRLTKIHGQAVSGRACAEIALWLEVPRMLAEEKPAGFDGSISIDDLAASERAMASIVEALIGACYLELGFERTADATLEAFTPQIALAAGTMLDFKSALQEQLARRREVVGYEVIAESGPPHERTFEVEARVSGTTIGRGTGSSKKAAEQAAAAQALQRDGA